MSHLQLVPKEGPLAEVAQSLLGSGLLVSSSGSTGVIDYLGARNPQGQHVGVSVLQWSDSKDRQVIIDISSEASEAELATVFAALTQAIRGVS